MTASLSKTQIDLLGDRLRQGPLVASDLKLLDDYRRSFGEAYEAVVRSIREQTQLEPTGRPAKSTGSLIEKLHRESIRLTQVQDIAGCRVVIADVAVQDRVVDLLRAVFSGASVIDRRANPSYGYRAVHLVVQISEMLVEIQVRSSLQHVWAELSEKVSDVLDPAIKYGGGPEGVRDMLAAASAAIALVEEGETSLARVKANVADLVGLQSPPLREEDLRLLEEGLREAEVVVIESKAELVKVLNDTISAVQNLVGRKP
ncbi:MAG: hypothetical protein ACREJ6_05955 [Candidatus Methylomirabilis sp.]